MNPPDDDAPDDELDDDLEDVAAAPAAATPMQKLAAELLGRLQKAEQIELVEEASKRAFLDGLADQLGALTPPKVAGPTLANWLSDHDAVEELYASDAELEAALKDSVAALKAR